LRSVTANTRVDGEEFLRIASRIAIRPTVTMYDFDDVNQALSDLAHDRFSGAAAIRVSAGP
jgi:propanol-preferring alcohol dehydrogenase